MTGGPGPAQGRTQPAIPEQAIEAARQRVGRDARTLVGRVRDFADRAIALLAAPADLRKSAQQQVATLTAQHAQQELHNRPVSALRDLVSKGVRIGTVGKAGFRTVGDVVAAPPYVLHRIPGVGPQSAAEIAHAAQVVHQQVMRETTFRFDPDRRDPAQTRLLAALTAIRHADSAVASLQGPLRQFVDQTGPLVSDAERTGSRLRMLFGGRHKKRAALAALVQLDAILADPRVASLQQTVQQVEHATNPDAYPPEQLWHQYATDAASYNALLSTVGGAGETDDAAAARGYIPEELRQEISAVPLDTSGLKATLRGYQVFAAQYAINQQRSILGDEMGLGKTVEALAVVAHLAANGQRRFLVVCPASVQINWLNEVAKHSHLQAYSLHGQDRNIAAQRWLSTGGVAVTTYNTLDRLEQIKGADIAMLVVDEAHFVKNPDAKRTQAVRHALGNAQRALFLTGTPMENRVEEFRNLVGSLQPHVAGRIDARDALAGAKTFRRAVAPVYLRRNQEDVLTELPDKIEVEDWVLCSDADEAAYREAVRSRNLMAMRQAAYRAPGSAKVERVCEIADEAREDGHKVVVYSYFLQVLAAIQRELGSAALGPLTGSVPPSQRQQLVDAFTKHDGHAVLLSQIEAGGVGLNIQAASVVVIAEPQWKPSTEEQAIARAYRMGQIRTAQVHRVLAKDSVDERLREIQERKSLLFDEYARQSDAKDADSRAVDPTEHRPAVLDDNAIHTEQRIVLAERHRLGIT